MKTLLVIYTGPEPQAIEKLLDGHDAGGYTELSHAHGSGVSGHHDGTRAWPGDATVFLSVVPEARVAALSDAFTELRSRLRPAERLHVAVLPTDSFI